MNQAFDMNGDEIKVNDTVMVHFDSGIETGTVTYITDHKTVNQPGIWVDVSINNQGGSGIPSYIIEVFKMNSFKFKMKGSYDNSQ